MRSRTSLLLSDVRRITKGGSCAASAHMRPTVRDASPSAPSGLEKPAGTLPT